MLREFGQVGAGQAIGAGQQLVPVGLGETGGRAAQVQLNQAPLGRPAGTPGPNTRYTSLE